MDNPVRSSFALAFLLLAGMAALPAQTVTGSVTGAVVDATGSHIPGASLKLISVSTGAVRTAETDAEGAFNFNAIQPGEYTLTAELAGFKKHERKNVVVEANDRLALGRLALELGDVAESVTVSAEGAAVQTASAERSGVITSEEVENLTVINRDFAALAALMPGVVDNPGAEVPGFSGNTTFNVLGGRTTSNNISIDGMPAENSNSGNTNTFVSIDSVATVKIQINPYQPEFGRKPGAGIQAITKAGTRQYHGSFYYYIRNEAFNANNFFNNRQGIAMTPLRINTAGGTIGGPLYIPGLFNRDKRRLFFFVSAEEIREMRPQSLRQVTTPTIAERGGDFSRSLDVNNRLIVVNDPENGKRPFPDNVVPASRIGSAGQKYLNLLPLPNFFNIDLSGRRYNYQFQESLVIPKRSDVLKVDYMLDRNTSMYGRLGYWWEDQAGSAVAAGNANWGWLPAHYINRSKSFNLSMTRVIGMSVLETSVAVQRWVESGPPLNQQTLDARDRKKLGVDLPQFHPENNPYNLVPQANFGGVNSPAQPSYATRFPLRGAETVMTVNTSYSRNMGKHVGKLGIFVERWRELKGEQGNFAGTLDFGRDSNSALDSNHPYANALLGVLKSYSESNSRLPVHGFVTGVEWYAQDNWRATRKLTFDGGLRFGWSQPWHSHRFDEAGFLPWRWNPAAKVQLVKPATVNGRRMAQDPITGEVFPVVAVSAISSKSGNPYNGIVNRREEPEYPQGLRYNSGLKLAPRFGFAYDPFGRGRTAVRGGWGLFYEVHERDNFTNNVTFNPPLREDPIIYYTTLDQYWRASTMNFPSSITGIDPRRPIQRMMNYSFGVQQALPFKTVMEVSYVASLGRHLIARRNLNSLPLGTRFLPSSLDATNGNRPFPDQFLRSHTGFNDINFYNYDTNSSYHSMQTTLNRRYAKGLTYGVAWTWSKAMDYVDGQDNNVSSVIDPKVWNYGTAGFDVTHVFKCYWTFDTPRLSRRWKQPWVKYVLDSWQLSGITTFASGRPVSVGYSLVNSVDVTGSNEGARVVVLANPVLPKSERGFSRNFNTGAFGPPAVGSWGNAAKYTVRGPGLNNWDISMFKSIPLPYEKFRLQFRAESYNSFNHTQFSSMDTGARFDAQGQQVNAKLSEFTGARNPRRLQLALRVTF